MCELRVYRQREQVIAASCPEFGGISLQRRASFVASDPPSSKAAMVDWAVLAAPLLLPISFLWDAFCFSRLWISYWLAQPDKQHSAKVFTVQSQVINCFCRLGKPLSIYPT